MDNIVLELVKDGNIEQCRDLCNELMAFQKSKANIAPESFDLMDFDTRMKRSYKQALNNQLVVAKDNGRPIGYVFSTIDNITSEAAAAFPNWAPRAQNSVGFYPNWVKLPQKIGCLNNLYLRDEYQGLGLGSALYNTAIEWLAGFSGVELVFVFISNGNDAALDFYLKRGFAFSHDVFGGFIKAAYMRTTGGA